MNSEPQSCYDPASHKGCRYISYVYSQSCCTRRAACICSTSSASMFCWLDEQCEHVLLTRRAEGACSPRSYQEQPISSRTPTLRIGCSELIRYFSIEIQLIYYCYILQRLPFCPSSCLDILFLKRTNPFRYLFSLYQTVEIVILSEPLKMNTSCIFRSSVPTPILPVSAISAEKNIKIVQPKEFLGNRNSLSK